MNEFVTNRHIEFETPTEVIFDLVKRATSQEPVRRAKIVRGYENEVYYVETRQSAFIVKIRRFGEVGFQQEAWAMERCREAGAPVSEVLLVDTIQSDGKLFEAMVQRRILGQPLNDVLWRLEKPALDKVIRQVGEILGCIHHSVQVEGFGRRHADGTWDFSTWERIMASAVRNLCSEKAHILHAGFSEQEFEFMMEMLQKCRDEFPCHKPVLCHGDFEPDHIFVDEHLKVSGVIDFGQFQGGPPILDFIHLSFVQPELDLEPFKSGYPDRGLIEDRFDRRLHLHRLGFLMGCVAYTTRIGDGDADKTPDASGQLKNTLKALRRWI
jgi:Ser/Thr protein kinase RdoA (MazF antagonist)